MKDQSTFWFSVKRYGYGWGLPNRWQGWLVLSAYFALVYGGIRYLGPGGDRLGLFVYLIVLTAVLVIVIALKGERPLRWRWGKK